MLSVQALVSRGAPAAIVIVLMGMLAAGCSTVASDEALTASTGRLDGTVRSDAGASVDGIEVSVWCDESAQGTAQEYSTTTNASGTFTLEDVEVGSTHTFSRTYEICVNCTPVSTSSIDARYGTYTGTVCVWKDEATPVEIEIEWNGDGPPDPAQYYDDTP